MLQKPDNSKSYRQSRRTEAQRQRRNKRARHREIARRYAWARGYRWGPPISKATIFTLVRMRELEAVFGAYYGEVLPNDDAGRDDLFIMAHHMAHLGGNDVGDRIAGLAGMWAPWASTAEIATVTERVLAKPIKWKADTLAKAIGLTAAMRTALRITTIGAIDMSKAERAKLRKLKRRARDRERHRQDGRKPRAQYLAEALTNTRPWEALGISRRTWERRGRPVPEGGASGSVTQVCGQQGSEASRGERLLATPPRAAFADRQGRGRPLMDFAGTN